MPWRVAIMKRLALDRFGNRLPPEVYWRKCCQKPALALLAGNLGQCNFADMYACRPARFKGAVARYCVLVVPDGRGIDAGNNVIVTRVHRSASVRPPKHLSKLPDFRPKTAAPKFLNFAPIIGLAKAHPNQTQERRSVGHTHIGPMSAAHFEPDFYIKKAIAIQGSKASS